KLDRFAAIVRFDDGIDCRAGGGEDLVARFVGREVRRPENAGVDDERRQALGAEQVTHELEFDAFGVERAEEEDGHLKVSFSRLYLGIWFACGPYPLTGSKRH